MIGRSDEIDSIDSIDSIGACACGDVSVLLHYAIRKHPGLRATLKLAK